MTTVLHPDLMRIAELRDRESLVLIARMLESQRTMLEAQVAQLRQLQDAVNERIQGLEGRP